MAAKGINNTSPSIILAPNAIHDYGFADLHASKSLVKHWESFQQATSIRSEPGTIPVVAELFPNYPNPFNPTTHIRYQLEKPSQVELTVQSILGEKIRTLVKARQSVGGYQVMWNGTNDQNQNVASGIYLLTFFAGTFSETRKMFLIR